MWTFSRKEVEPTLRKEPETVQINASDDLLRRAEVIVRVMGYGGAIGSFILDVHHVLREYERLDKEGAALKKVA